MEYPGDEETEQDIQNRADVQASIEETLDLQQADLPKNTKRIYAPKQRMWRTWCNTHRFKSGSAVSEGKALLFLKEVVVPQARPKKGDALSYSAIDSYVKALAALHKIQSVRGGNNSSTPRGPAIRAFLQRYENNASRRRRSGIIDRGAGRVSEVYTQAELEKINSILITTGSYLDSRTRMDVMLGHSALGRGELKRKIQFADLFTVRFDGEGSTECPVLVIASDQGKMNRSGRVEYHGAMRHREVTCCSLNALGFYLLERWADGRDAFPDLSARSKWYDMYLLRGKNERSEIHYTTQAAPWKKVLLAAGVKSSKVTHICRSSGARLAEENGASELDIRRAGHWKSGSMELNYLDNLPKGALRALAGFPAKRGSFGLSRAVVVPPLSLQKYVFPQVEGWEHQLATRDAASSDLAASDFLLLLHELRVVILQDAAVLKPKFPASYLWHHPVFSCAQFLEFQHKLLLEMAKVAEEGTTTQGCVVRELPSTCARCASPEMRLHNIDVRLSRMEQRQLAQAVTVRTNSITELSPGALTETVEATATLSAAPPTLPPPTYIMAKRLPSIANVWQEYTVGLGQGPAVRELDRLYRTEWRRNPSVDRFYRRRVRVYKAVMQIAKAREIEPSKAVSLLEADRLRRGLSVTVFSDQAPAIVLAMLS